MDHDITPTHFYKYDETTVQTTYYMVLDFDSSFVLALITTIDAFVTIEEDESDHRIVSISSSRRRFVKSEFDAIEKTAMYGIDYHASITSAYRKLGVTVPRERVVDELYVTACELAEQLHKVSEDSVGIFMNAAAHGVKYTGATYEHELKALREVLVEFHKTVDNKKVN